MEKLKHFWIQPSKGFTKETKGVTEEQLKAKELEIGFKFPEHYSSLMKLQNGGYLRNYLINDQLGLEAFEPLENAETFLDYLYGTKSDQDLKEMYQQFEFCDPKRLISFASLYGHGVACFDYGWLQKEVIRNPEIVFISDDGDDFLDYGIEGSFKNFDTFLAQFKHQFDGRYWSETALVITSNLSFKSFITALQKLWDIDFEVKTDDRYGWYNFEKYYLGSVPLWMDDDTVKEYVDKSGPEYNDMLEWMEKEGRRRLIKSVFSPNQHVSGTFLFPENEDANIVIEIKNPWFPKKRTVEQLKNELESNERLEINKIILSNNV